MAEHEVYNPKDDEVVMVDGNTSVSPIMLVTDVHAGMSMHANGAELCFHFEGEDPKGNKQTVTMFLSEMSVAVKIVQQICRGLFDADGVEQVRTVFQRLVIEQADTESVIMRHYDRFTHPEKYDGD